MQHTAALPQEEAVCNIVHQGVLNVYVARLTCLETDQSGRRKLRQRLRQGRLRQADDGAEQIITERAADRRGPEPPLRP